MNLMQREPFISLADIYKLVLLFKNEQIKVSHSYDPICVFIFRFHVCEKRGNNYMRNEEEETSADRQLE
jgi:hypothetical protein